MGFLADSRAQVVPRTLLVVLRLFLGIGFLRSGVAKLTAGAELGPRMTRFLEQSLPDSYPFYRAFLESVVLPHQELFARLVTWMEILVGVALLLGLLTRLAALAAIAMNLNYLLVKGSELLGPNNDAAFIFMALVLLVGAAGRAYGLDLFLARRWPRSPLW